MSKRKTIPESEFVLQEGCILAKLLTLLTVAGEVPVSAIPLLGNYKSYMRVIQKARKVCKYCNAKTQERYTVRLLTIVGKDKQRAVRMLSGTEPILDWLGLLEDYQQLHINTFTGNQGNRERIHRSAEGYAMMLSAGAEIVPSRLPKLQREVIQNTFENKQGYYGRKQVKEVAFLKIDKSAYTRIIGALFGNRKAFAVYNTRGEPLRWSVDGERTACVYLKILSNMNANLYNPRSAILFGENAGVAIKTLENHEKIKKNETLPYNHLYFIPLNENGIRQLRILLLENWHEELLSVLFPEEIRIQQFDMCDAMWQGKHVCVYMHGDLAKLAWIRRFGPQIDAQFEVVCFPFQADFVKAYLGDLATVKVIALDVVEKALGIENGQIKTHKNS